MTHPSAPLARTLGVGDTVVVGLVAMIGAGVFAALAPAAAAAGDALLVALGLAAVVAWCNATSSARLAAVYPASGGTYVYGRERLGPFWGFLAGWVFVVGKTASCAAMALTAGAYLWPAYATPVAVLAVVAVTGLNVLGIQRSARIGRVVVAVVLALLAAVVAVCLLSDAATPAGASFDATTPRGLLQAAGLLFFAFAGYARITTLGEEVREPERTIPRAVPLALGITVLVYAAVAWAVLAVLGPDRLAAATDPLAEAVRVAGAPGLAPFVRVGAGVAALGALLALVLGVSRTVLAMARDRYLPYVLAAVHPGAQVPRHAVVAVGIVVAALTAAADLRGAIGFSSFGVLLYYAIANASALRLGGPQRRLGTPLAVLGLVGCLALAFALPLVSVIGGLVMVVLGTAVYAVRR
ncbi:APA family basic amino acid/polyamine antiporter [Mumia flava]|uniref:APA family basic amino acid/polyamine antiporter n=1 Tax=Mumia flava TaxID=1348852 RepID=A0A0B2B8X5_9ACTN|nr:APC family permease [Mumia flava]PJJ53379.1 APA family basic amino acid/polyamine antiporter [Mumia flava]